MGQQAASELAGYTANILTGIGSAQSAVPLARAQARGQGISSLMGLAGTLGGAVLGGPVGAAAGGAIGSSLGGAAGGAAGSSLGGGMTSNWFNF